MSNIAINYVKKKIVICPHRIGSNRLNDEVLSKRRVWLKPNTPLEYFIKDEQYQIYGAVRHPISRFKSWFMYFASSTNQVHPKLKPISRCTHSDIVNYFNEFQYSCHYDNHTSFQHIQWRQLGLPDLSRIKFFEMTQLERILDYKEKQITTVTPNSHWDSYMEVCDLKEYIVQQAELIYVPDIEWYNNLDKIG
jgi:hypothetical protein